MQRSSKKSSSVNHFGRSTRDSCQRRPPPYSLKRKVVEAQASHSAEESSCLTSAVDVDELRVDGEGGQFSACLPASVKMNFVGSKMHFSAQVFCCKLIKYIKNLKYILSPLPPTPVEYTPMARPTRGASSPSGRCCTTRLGRRPALLIFSKIRNRIGAGRRKVNFQATNVSLFVVFQLNLRKFKQPTVSLFPSNLRKYLQDSQTCLKIATKALASVNYLGPPAIPAKFREMFAEN